MSLISNWLSPLFSHTHSVPSSFFSHMFGCLPLFSHTVQLPPPFSHTCSVVSLFFLPPFLFLPPFFSHLLLSPPYSSLFFSFCLCRSFFSYLSDLPPSFIYLFPLLPPFLTHFLFSSPFFFPLIRFSPLFSHTHSVVSPISSHMFSCLHFFFSHTCS